VNHYYDEWPEAGTYNGRRSRDRRRPRSSAAAQLLSFVWPGLGQLYLGQAGRALLYLLPPLLLIGGVVFLALQSPQAFAVRLLVPAVMLGALMFIAGHALWRVLSIVDAWSSARTRPISRDSSLPLMVVLSLVVVLAHGFAGYYLQSVASAAAPIFDGGDGDLDDVIGKVPGGALPAEGPINVLFVGVDSASNRTHALTDTIMLASFDRERRQVVQISIPRDTGRLPMYDGTTFGPRINSLLSRAGRNPERYPDGPIGTLTREVGYLLGVDVHYYAVVNMDGFKQLIDAVGGVKVEVTKPIADPVRKLYLEPGTVHLDGKTALDYVRSRYGPRNNDYERARRQQQVIRALGHRALDPFVLARLPEIMGIGAQLARTNIPLDQLDDLLALMEQANRADTRQIVLSPSRYAQRIPPAEVNGRFMTELKMDAVAELSVELFGSYSRYAQTGAP
jgi:polyisoprenyl-teichoic acid--peptidoglycan teichoic acid transferase